jgi:hypothetical protein
MDFKDYYKILGSSGMRRPTRSRPRTAIGPEVPSRPEPGDKKAEERLKGINEA